MHTANELYPQDRLAWRSWLEAHHATERSVWLIYDKDLPDHPRRLPYDAIVEEALCFGWVDSVPGKVSETQAKIYVSKRKPTSAWSRANKDRIAVLRAKGLMTPAGEQAVAVAQANGMWDHLEVSDRFEMPSELAEQLAANPVAQAFYDTMPQLLAPVATALPRLELIWADSAYVGPLQIWVKETFGWPLQIVARPGGRGQWLRADQEPPPRRPGFQSLPHRWIVERTISWIGRNRRMSKDDEFLPSTSETWVYLSMVRLMLKRLAHEQVQPAFHYRRVAYRRVA